LSGHPGDLTVTGHVPVIVISPLLWYDDGSAVPIVQEEVGPDGNGWSSLPGMSC